MKRVVALALVALTGVVMAPAASAHETQWLWHRSNAEDALRRTLGPRLQPSVARSAVYRCAGFGYREGVFYKHFRCKVTFGRYWATAVVHAVTRTRGAVTDQRLGGG